MLRGVSGRVAEGSPGRPQAVRSGNGRDAVDLDPPGGELVGAHACRSGTACPPTGRCARRRCATGGAGRRGASGRRRARSPSSSSEPDVAGRCGARSGTATAARSRRARTRRRRRPRRAIEPARLVRSSLGVPARARRSRARAPPAGTHHRERSSPSSVLEASSSRVPEVGGDVLPAAVGEDGDDDALVELRGDAPGDVDGSAARDAGEDALARAGAPARARPTPRSRRGSSGRASTTSRIGGT